MTDAIEEVAKRIVDISGRPLDALAVSLSCEFLARAASERPTLFRTLALVSPTGFSGSKILRAAPGRGVESAGCTLCFVDLDGRHSYSGSSLARR